MLEHDIVVVNDNHEPEAGWQCKNNDEALRMVRWLKENGVKEAKAVSLTHFND
jgi:hypothetical protein